MTSATVPRIVPIPAFESNYIWAIHCGDYAMVIDPGDASVVLQWLKEQGDLPLQCIYVTHQHSDHIGGVATLQQHSACQVFAPAFSAMPEPYQPVHDGLVHAAGAGQMQVLATPGHTGEHLSYLYTLPDQMAQAPALFCGDTLFVLGCGRVFRSLGGSAAALHASLQRLAQLPENTRVYCAHEYTLQNVKFCESEQQHFPLPVEWPAFVEQLQNLRLNGLATVPSTIAQELRFNPFLRCSDVEQFSQLRQRKDSFV